MTEFQGGRLEDVQLQGAFLDGAQLQGASLENVQLQGATLDGAQLQGALFKDVRLKGAALKKVRLQGAIFDGVQLQGADLADIVLSSALLSHVWVWHAANADCTKARVIGRKPDSVIEIGGEVGEWMAKSSIPPAEATPSEISKFIERAVARIPDAGPLNKKTIIAARMHRILDVELAKDDTEAIAKRWSDCEEASVKIAREQFDKEHAKLLRKLVCDDLIAERKYIAQNIVSTWISETEDRRAFTAQLARGLLGEDGEHCAATKDFDEPIKERLHKVVEKMANASPAVPTPPTAPVQ